MTEEQNEPAYKKSLLEGADALGTSDVLSPSYIRKKLLLWFIRNLITALVCWYFWEKPWVRWVLWIGIPLATISLLLILLGPYLLRRKLKSIQRNIRGM